jgi:hypothetical protein
MTDRSLAIRLAVIDGGKVKAELRDVGDTGSRSLKRIEDAARPASRALQALDGVSSEVRGGLEAMSGRLGAVGSGLARLGPIGLAAGAALAGIGIAVSKSIEEAAEADRSYRRLEAVLKATGYASGLTAKQIAAFSDGIEASTLATAEGVQDAAAILATFRSVSGDTFTRALTLAQDMAAVFGQDLSSAATQLGKALEDPIDGLTALRRVGVSFSDSQKELIRTLVETGRTADAQRVILDALEKQVGGAGAAEAGGLTGATNRLGDAWGNLLEAIGRTPAVTGIAQGALDLLSSAIEGLTGALADDPIGGQIEAAKVRLTEARDELARLEAGGPGTPLLGQRFDLDAQRSRVAALEKELDALTRIGEAETRATEAEKARAEAGRRAADAERRADALSGQRRALDKAFEQLLTDPAEKIAAVNRELAETRQRLDALRAPDGSNTSGIDAAIGQAEEIARRKITQIRQPLASRFEREADSEHQAAERAYEASARVIDDLSRQFAGFGDERQQFIDQALARLSDGVTAHPLGFSGYRRWRERTGEEVADGLQGGLAMEPGCAGDGAVAGVDLGAPVRAEASGDLAEHHRWPDFPFAGVVGCRYPRIFEEDEELRPPGLDRGLQFAAGGMRRGCGNERIEAPVRAGVIVPERRVLELASSPADADRPAQQLAQPGREHRIAAVDGILHVAQNMGEADLVRRGQILLAGVAVGHPDFGPMLAQHRFGDRFRPARCDRVQHRLGGHEHPVPVAGAADPGGGLVRGDHPGGLEPVPDRRTRRRHRPCGAPEGVGDRTLGDLEPEQFRHHPRQPFEPSMVAVVQIQKQRPDPGAERRSRRHAVRCRGAEAVAAGGAAPAEQLDARHHWCDRRQVDVIVAMAATLRLPRDVGSAVGAGRRQPLDRLVRCVAERPRRARARRPRLAPFAVFPVPGPARLAVLRWRCVAVLRGLLRPRQQRFEFRNPRRQTLDQRRLLGKQRVLLTVVQAVSERRSHPYLDSHPAPPRNQKMPTP